jgi:4-amino-4-deoxy-L-arabinose transferase-like glycosyltransferase
MFAKKILAGIFAVLILVKLAALLINPAGWMALGKVFLEHHAMVTGIYLILIAITGFFIFSSINLIDLALVMFFTSLLIGLTLIPYSTQMQQLGDAMVALGLGQAWLALVIWGAVAVAVLYKVLSKKRR